MNADDEHETTMSGSQGKPKTEGNEQTTTEHKEEEVQDEEQTKFNVQKVRTKVDDGGTILQDGSTGSDRLDVFLRYSNDNVRMTHLLGLDDEDPEAANEDNTHWQQITGYRGLRRIREGSNANDENARKTRLSTELHLDAFRNIFFGNEEQEE